MAKTSDQERDYHARRSIALAEARKAHPGVTIKSLRDVPGGLSLAKSKSKAPAKLPEPTNAELRAEAEAEVAAENAAAKAAKPKRIRKSRAKKSKDAGPAKKTLSVLSADVVSVPRAEA